MGEAQLLIVNYQFFRWGLAPVRLILIPENPPDL